MSRASSNHARVAITDRQVLRCLNNTNSGLTAREIARDVRHYLDGQRESEHDVDRVHELLRGLEPHFVKSIGVDETSRAVGPRPLLWRAVRGKEETVSNG